MGSTRLPGKVIREFAGKPLIQHVLERISSSVLIDEVLVATSDSPSELPLVEICQSLGVNVYRGSEDDVLARLSGLMELVPEAIHVECFGDSPFIDPRIIDNALSQFLTLRHEIDFLSNTLTTTYPPGMEFMIYPSRRLIEVNKMVVAQDPLREHGGYNLSRFPDVFRSLSLKAPPHLHRPETYLELDTAEDLAIVSAIFDHFQADRGSNLFSLEEILDFLDKSPGLIHQNQNVHRRWKALRD